MIRSMTAFARQTRDSDGTLLTWEIKSVNHRFSEVSLRLPEDFRILEPKIREQVGKQVKRGKVDAILRYQAPELQASGVAVDQELIKLLTTAGQEVKTLLPDTAPINVMDILRWPGVLKSPEQDFEALGQTALDLLQTALAELIETREREGRQIKQHLLDCCAGIEEQVKRVQARLPEAMQAMRDRITERLAELTADLDDARVEQEMVILLNKADVAEEMQRLATHVQEVRRVLDEDKPVGRRLDFLMQELNREANTLGSKSVDADTTQASVEMKVLIEQMREQVQNIE
jgi:uncharacterized protein (TIGR00255 family)